MVDLLFDEQCVHIYNLLIVIGTSDMQSKSTAHKVINILSLQFNEWACSLCKR